MQACNADAVGSGWFAAAHVNVLLQGRQGEAAALSARVAELLKENSLLKRAVAIQQTRWQEAVSQRDQQASQMQEVVSQLQVTTTPFYL